MLTISISVFSASSLGKKVPMCSVDFALCVGLHIQPALKALNYLPMFEEKCSLLFRITTLISELGILPRWLISVIEKVATLSLNPFWFGV